jgi:replicative DNA helicase
MNLQIELLTHIIKNRDYSVIARHEITAEDFEGGFDEEIRFVLDHYKQYREVPSEKLFAATFPDFIFGDESDSIDKIIYELNNARLYPALARVGEVMSASSEYDVQQAIKQGYEGLATLYAKVASGQSNEYIPSREASGFIASREERAAMDNSGYLSTGFAELDEAVTGWNVQGELVVLFARTGQGKSWVLLKMLHAAWKAGETVTFLSPEMTAEQVLERFVTIDAHISNLALATANLKDCDSELLENYFSKTDGLDRIHIITEQEFENRITVSKLRVYCERTKTGVLAIDGLSDMIDERAQRYDSGSVRLANISQDLMALSRELEMPVLSAVQANRQGVPDKNSGYEAPRLEHIRDSDGIAHKASAVISMRQLSFYDGQENEITKLVLNLRKNRTGRTPDDGLIYSWDIDAGIFVFEKMTSQVEEDEYNNSDDSEQTAGRRRHYGDSD